MSSAASRCPEKKKRTCCAAKKGSSGMDTSAWVPTVQESEGISIRRSGPPSELTTWNRTMGRKSRESATHCLYQILGSAQECLAGVQGSLRAGPLRLAGPCLDVRQSQVDW